MKLKDETRFFSSDDVAAPDIMEITLRSNWPI